MYRFFILIVSLLLPIHSYGLDFPLPENGDNVVGKPRTAQVKRGEDFSDVAIRYNVGYYEIFEANSTKIDPDKPPLNTVLVIPTQYILPLELVPDTVVINLAEMRLYYQPKNEKKIYIFPVGIGKENWNTPEGVMSIVEKKKNPTWVVPKSIRKFRKTFGDKIKSKIPPGPDNPLGDYALRLSNRTYLIHGTNLPAGVGRRSTAGCIRLYPKNIKELYNKVAVSTKVVIINKPYKAGWKGKKLYLEAHMPLFEQRMKIGSDIKLAIDAVNKSNVTRDNQAKISWQKVDAIAREHLVVPRAVN